MWQRLRATVIGPSCLWKSISPRRMLLSMTAMRLMGALGGKRIIEPFKKVILHDRSARKREYALRWITQGPWDQAAKVISQAAENDPDANVRKVAQELLSGHGP